MVGLLCSLARNRLRHLLAYISGPSSLPFCSPGIWALARLRSFWTGYTQVAALKTPTSEALQKRAWMGQPACEPLFQPFDAMDFIFIPIICYMHQVNLILRKSLEIIDDCIASHPSQSMRMINCLQRLCWIHCHAKGTAALNQPLALPGS